MWLLGQRMRVDPGELVREHSNLYERMRVVRLIPRSDLETDSAGVRQCPLTLSRNDSDECEFLVADASGPERSGVNADLLEGAGDGFDVAVGEVVGEVLFDGVSVVAARRFHRLAACVGEDDED